MKRFQFLLFTLIAASLDLRAQIPNGGFELWNTTSGYETPDGWDNLNAMTSPMGIYTCEMGAPGVPGASYLELTSRLVSGMGVVPGVAVSGVMDEEVLQASSGFAFGGRPASFTGMWQYMAFGNDQGYIAVYLTKWDTVANTREPVASAVHDLTGMEMSWTNFNINLTYTSGEAPDTALIVLAASTASPDNLSYLYVDDLAFTGTMVGIEEDNTLLGAVGIYPNPASDAITIDLGTRVQENLLVEVIDAAGRVVHDVRMGTLGGTRKLTVSTAGISPGMYQVKFTAAGSSFTKALVIQ